MTQNTLKIVLSVLATIVVAVLGAQTAGQVHLPKLAVELLGVAGTVLGMFGASPIGRVVGTKEVRVPVKNAPQLLDTSALKKPPSPTSEEITADDRPSGRLPR